MKENAVQYTQNCSKRQRRQRATQHNSVRIVEIIIVFGVIYTPLPGHSTRVNENNSISGGSQGRGWDATHTREISKMKCITTGERCDKIWGQTEAERLMRPRPGSLLEIEKESERKGEKGEHERSGGPDRKKK
ncbi:hypothetical protein RUM43_006876 [Polyplax serrata]|uniref:Uncharacterized protein n=1 Tax=Polyplax serrata TaxID=468196 RepID=A0AAN8P4Z1_POLSC